MSLPVNTALSIKTHGDELQPNVFHFEHALGGTGGSFHPKPCLFFK